MQSNEPNLELLLTLTRILERVFESPHLRPQLDPYLHQILPIVVSCMVAERLSARWNEDHWELRRMAAGIIQSVSTRLFHKYPSLQQRLVSQLRQRIDTATHSQAYGILLALRALQPRVVEIVLHPIMEKFLEDKVRAQEGEGGRRG